MSNDTKAWRSHCPCGEQHDGVEIPTLTCWMRWRHEDPTADLSNNMKAWKSQHRRVWQRRSHRWRVKRHEGAEIPPPKCWMTTRWRDPTTQFEWHWEDNADEDHVLEQSRGSAPNVLFVFKNSVSCNYIQTKGGSTLLWDNILICYNICTMPQQWNERQGKLCVIK